MSNSDYNEDFFGKDPMLHSILGTESPIDKRLANSNDQYTKSSLDTQTDLSKPTESVVQISPVAKLPIPIQEWPEPEDINPHLLPVPSFPEDLIPEFIKGWVKDVVHRMQVPLSFAATSAFVIAGSLIGTACGIRPKQKDDWLVIPNLWGGIVADPGKLKSPTLEAIAKPLGQLEATAKNDYEEALIKYQLEHEEFKTHKAVLQELLKEAIKHAEKNKEK